MKKLVLAIAFITVAGVNGNAQLSKGGLPLSIQQPEISASLIKQHNYPLPNWNAVLQQESEEYNTQKEGIVNSFSKPYLVGLFTDTKISFPNSGTWSQNIKGNKIWQTQIRIQDAPAISVYFDQFHLPEGVKLFVSNKNKQQVLGAYTSENNTKEGYFSIEAVEGDLVNIELNIPENVNLNEIRFDIERSAVLFRAISYLSQYTEKPLKAGELTTVAQPDPYKFEGNSSTCQIDANCPEGDGFEISKKATVQILIPAATGNGLGLCSATLINNTGNSKEECKQYILTAAHCQGSNEMTPTHKVYAQTQVRFNFEKPTCQSDKAATVNTLTGVTLLARSFIKQTSSPQINGDFLLVEMKSYIPPSWGAWMSGWNRDASITTSVTAPDKFIGFHHPSGDIKKVSYAQEINPNGHANGSDAPGTHWAIDMTTGGIEQGSSGSGLFDPEGYLIGIASIASYPPKPNCEYNKKNQRGVLHLTKASYSKLSYDWEYLQDSGNDDSQLAPWLDPTQSGVTYLDPVRSNCTTEEESPAGIELPDNSKEFENGIGIYPNPSNNGIFNAVFNFKIPTDLKVEVISMTGRSLKTFNISRISNQTYAFELLDLPNGIYIMKFNNGKEQSIKKVSIIK